MCIAVNTEKSQLRNAVINVVSNKDLYWFSVALTNDMNNMFVHFVFWWGEGFSCYNTHEHWKLDNESQMHYRFEKLNKNKKPRIIN